MKKINLFKILAGIIILTTFVFIITANIIAKTNIENKLYQEQKSYFEKYVSEVADASKTIELLNELFVYIDEKFDNPEIVPTVEFYGKDNDNHIMLYTVRDELQKDNYKKEMENVKNKIEAGEDFFIVCEYDSNNEYITKIVIERN